jgi:predicted ATP-dependent endonuclease of OLD family
MATSYIKRVEISKLWGKYDIVWDNLHADVNILVGINGSGKTTLLKVINALLFLDRKPLQKLGIDKAKLNGCPYSIDSTKYSLLIDYQKGGIVGSNFENEFEIGAISTFDVPVTNKSKLKQDESPLMLELRDLILQTGSNSFNDYRLKATQSIELANKTAVRIIRFFDIINDLFKNTGKHIEISSNNNIEFRTSTDIIQLDQLSSGEKQLLLILFKVFLMDEKPFVLLMDEPEISLHIGWQQDLIETIRTLNPNCQLIIATHSPSIFGKGWGDKITFMENLIKM